MPSPLGVREFLSAIWGESEGIAELATINAEKKVIAFPFTYPASLDSFVTAVKNHSGKSNVYFGVSLKKPGTKYGYDAVRKKGQRATAEDSLSLSDVWIDCDFPGMHKGTVIEPEVIRERLKNFPLRPTFVVKTGGGIQAHWALKEPAVGLDLERAHAVVKALITHFGADRQVSDLARVLRVPGTVNMNREPLVTAEISYPLSTEIVKYNLSEFEEILNVETKSMVHSPESLVGTKDQGQRTTDSSALADSERTTLVELAAAAKEKLKNALADIWVNGHRHALAVYISGAMALAGVRIEDAKEVIAGASNAVGGTTEKRMRDVEDSYRDFHEGRMVGGIPTLLEKIEDNLLREKVKKAWDSTKRSLPKTLGVSGFSISRVVKFDSRPAHWRVTLRFKNGDEATADVDTDNYSTWKNFKKKFLEQTNHGLLLSQPQWDVMLAEAKTRTEVLPAPEEATPKGALGIAINEFVDEKKENADTGMLKAFPGYSEKEVYFRFAAFKAAVKERGLKLEDDFIYQFLKAQGWATGPMRFGDKVVRVWSKEYQNGHSNGQQKCNTKPDQLELALPTENEAQTTHEEPNAF